MKINDCPRATGVGVFLAFLAAAYIRITIPDAGSFWAALAIISMFFIFPYLSVWAATKAKPVFDAWAIDRMTIRDLRQPRRRKRKHKRHHSAAP